MVLRKDHLQQNYLSSSFNICKWGGGGGGGGGKKTLYACTERLSGYNQKRIHFYNGLGW